MDSVTKQDDAALSILRAAEEVPERPAWLFGDASKDGEVWTYARVAEAVRGEIAALRGEDLPPVVPVVGELRPGVLVRIYALIELGHPLALLHPRWTEAERARRVAMLAETSYLGRGTPMWVPCGEAASASSPAQTPEGRHRGADRMGLPLPRTRPDLHSPLALLFTSGTTSEPKIAVLSRRAFLAAANASAENLGWIDGDRWWLGLPIGHVGGLSVLTRCLVARRTVVMQRTDAGRADAVAAVVKQQGVTLMSLVPTMLRRLLKLPDWTPPPSLRAVLVGGAATPAGLLDEARQRGVPVLATYGLTEACAQVTTQRYRSLDENATDAGVGPPLDGVGVRIVDGEVQVAGGTLMDGYWTPATATTAAGLDRSAFTDDGWLRTGDLGRLDAHGRLHLLGRAKELIISGGENVHPAEVEAALLAHPAITAACVFGVDDAEWGEVVAAALVAPEEPTDENLLNFLETQLARFKRPRRVAYVQALPVNATGKIDRREAAVQTRAYLRHLGTSPASDARP